MEFYLSHEHSPFWYDLDEACSALRTAQDYLDNLAVEDCVVMMAHAQDIIERCMKELDYDTEAGRADDLSCLW